MSPVEHPDVTLILLSEPQAQNILTRYFGLGTPGRTFGQPTRIDALGLIQKGGSLLHAFLVNTNRYPEDPIKATVNASGSSGPYAGWVGISAPGNWDYTTFLEGKQITVNLSG